MKTLASRLFQVRSEEFALVAVLGFLLFANSVALQIANIVSISGFLSDVGVDQLLIVWVIDMLLIIVAASGQALIVDRFNRIQLLRGMSFGFALFYVILGVMFVMGVPSIINYSLLFLLAEQQWFFFPLVFWILANDIFEITQTKRLFPFIASFGFIGEIVGLGIAAAAPATLKAASASYQLLYLVVLIYLVICLLTYGLRNVKIRQIRQKHETVRETLTEGWGFVREVPSFRYLMLSMLAVAICTTMIEYHFLVAADKAFSSPDTGITFQTFFSLVTLAQVITAIVLQSFVTSRIIGKFGLKNTFLIMPVLTLGSLVAITGLPTIMSATGAFLQAKLTSHTIDQSARKSLQALVPEERRGRVSVFIDTYLFATGVIVGSAIIGLFLALRPLVQRANFPDAYLFIGIAAAIIAVISIFKMRGVYDSSLFNWRLKRRQRTTSGVLDKLDI